MARVYDNLKSNRRYNNILEISKDEWIKWWIDTGRWDEREEHHGLIMARLDTTIPFRLDNIYLTTRKELGKSKKK
jgi:hypothetical protein